ncbi:uncharacterized protein LOC134806744 [Cydia splendana]|uniref:uncharacterized protein LOC134806744 n=1 Tax=Cydia splendana TaxID=1100963 RepID=UPI00300C7947
MSTTRMERAGRRSKAGSLSGLSGGLGSTPGAGVRRQRSLEWSGDRYSSSDDDRPPQPPPLADRVFASLLAQATQQFDNEQRRIYGSECGEEPPRYVSSPQRQASPFPLESTARRFCRRNRNSKGEELFAADASGTLSRRGRRSEDFAHDNNARHRIDNGTTLQMWPVNGYSSLKGSYLVHCLPILEIVTDCLHKMREEVARGFVLLRTAKVSPSSMN